MNCIRLIRSHNIRFLQNQAIVRISRVNYVSQHPIKFTETQDRLREKDGVSKQWQLIYKAPMEKILQFTTAYLTFSITTISCSLVYYSAFIFDTATMHEPIVLGNDVVIANNSMECLIYLGSFILLHVAVKLLLSKYVIRLYQKGDNYLAIFRGHTYSSINKHEFHLNEFKKLNPSLLISWSDARFALGKKKGILLENYFKTPEYFNYLLYKKSAADSDDNQ
ncbi:PREDICTED: uncharacterized protein LOC106117054 [Papilio xuthus]|uniref:Uncharacterized protein LOC106117054 n=1 Tax=Papilio xuthus TaxID=66420 RepID=A0A194PR99_PAPXU|nr:PREDICTED: uncharacterized protein LOC106117054 [Papilio xuthus]KPI95483.1 hypothetical protein RR46_08942 [Papilio xuthus]